MPSVLPAVYCPWCGVVMGIDLLRRTWWCEVGHLWFDSDRVDERIRSARVHTSLPVIGESTFVLEERG